MTLRGVKRRGKLSPNLKDELDKTKINPKPETQNAQS